MSKYDAAKKYFQKCYAEARPIFLDKKDHSIQMMRRYAKRMFDESSQRFSVKNQGDRIIIEVNTVTWPTKEIKEIFQKVLDHKASFTFFHVAINYNTLRKELHRFNKAIGYKSIMLKKCKTPDGLTYIIYHFKVDFYDEGGLPQIPLDVEANKSAEKTLLENVVEKSRLLYYRKAPSNVIIYCTEGQRKTVIEELERLNLKIGDEAKRMEWEDKTSGGAFTGVRVKRKDYVNELEQEALSNATDNQ